MDKLPAATILAVAVMAVAVVLRLMVETEPWRSILLALGIAAALASFILGIAVWRQRKF